MRKILTLLALLVMTITATAAEYTDKLVYTLFGGSISITKDQGQVIIETTDDHDYRVTFKDCDFTEKLGMMNLGDITFSNLEGTTENGITTIESQGPTVNFSNETDAQSTTDKLIVKFAGNKAYAKYEGAVKPKGYSSFYTFQIDFGTDDGYETTPTVEYPINFDKDANATRTDRHLSSVSLQEEGAEKQTVTTGSYKPYVDRSADEDGKFTVKAGSTLTATFGYSGVWMHGYVYIDENNDKQFSYKEGSTDQSGTELKAFSFYSGNFNDDSSGYNSNGDAITGDDRSKVDPPSFTAPTEPGTYRIRFKVDWNSVDPGGQKAADGTCTGKNGILANGGAILDATLVVEAAEPPFVSETKEFTAPAYVDYGDKKGDFDEAKMEITTVSKELCKVTYKDVTIDKMTIGDFTINNVAFTADAENEGVYTLATTDTEGTWSGVNPTFGNLIGVENGSTSAISDFTGTLTVTDKEAKEATLKASFGISITGETAKFVFGDKRPAPADPEGAVDVVDHGFAPAGESWSTTKDVDWDKQYIKAEIDLSTCKTTGAGPENVLAIGGDLTGWNNGPHYFFYYNAADKILQYNYLHSANSSLNGGFANLSRAYLKAEGVVTIELSKRHGLKINGESCLIKYVSTANSPETNGKESWTEDELAKVFSGLWAMSEVGFGGCQGSTMSNATYNYIHILPLPVEVVDTKTYTDEIKIAGEDLTSDNGEMTIEKKSDGTAVVTIKNFPVEGTKTCDLTVDASTFQEYTDDGKNYFQAIGTSTFNEEAVNVQITGQYKTDGTVYANINIYTDDSATDIMAIFGSQEVDGINAVNTGINSGKAEIYTVGGMKVGSLQKGINIVRTADGKTIKIIK